MYICFETDLAFNCFQFICPVEVAQKWQCYQLLTVSNFMSTRSCIKMAMLLTLCITVLYGRIHLDEIFHHATLEEM